MKNIIIAALGFIACQIFTIWMCANSNFSTTTDEVDMEIYEFEHEGHKYMIFEENGRTISVIHNLDCNCRLHDVK